MADAEGLPQVGDLMTLVSDGGIRYEGTLQNFDIDNSSITLTSVRCFGTEGRREGVEAVAATAEIYPYIVFDAAEIVELTAHAQKIPSPPPVPLPATVATWNAPTDAAHAWTTSGPDELATPSFAASGVPAQSYALEPAAAPRIAPGSLAPAPAAAVSVHRAGGEGGRGRGEGGRGGRARGGEGRGEGRGGRGEGRGGRGEGRGGRGRGPPGERVAASPGPRAPRVEGEGADPQAVRPRRPRGGAEGAAPARPARSTIPLAAPLDIPEGEFDFADNLAKFSKVEAAKDPSPDVEEAGETSGPAAQAPPPANPSPFVDDFFDSLTISPQPPRREESRGGARGGGRGGGRGRGGSRPYGAFSTGVPASDEAARADARRGGAAARRGRGRARGGEAAAET